MNDYTELIARLRRISDRNGVDHPVGNEAADAIATLVAAQE